MALFATESDLLLSSSTASETTDIDSTGGDEMKMKMKMKKMRSKGGDVKRISEEVPSAR